MAAKDYTQQFALPDICARFRCSAAGPAHLVWWLVNNAPEVSSLEPQREEHCFIQQLSGKLGFSGQPDRFPCSRDAYDPAFAVLFPLCACYQATTTKHNSQKTAQ